MEVVEPLGKRAREEGAAEEGAVAAAAAAAETVLAPVNTAEL